MLPHHRLSGSTGSRIPAPSSLHTSVALPSILKHFIGVTLSSSSPHSVSVPPGQGFGQCSTRCLYDLAHQSLLVSFSINAHGLSPQHSSPLSHSASVPFGHGLWQVVVFSSDTPHHFVGTPTLWDLVHVRVVPSTVLMRLMQLGFSLVHSVPPYAKPRPLFFVCEGRKREEEREMG